MDSVQVEPAGFAARKKKILEQLAVPSELYQDASPKGSVDAEIAELVAYINAQSGLVTTSSCAGRLSIFLEGARFEKHQTSENDAIENSSGPVSASEGGKGGGGRWLFVSHTPIPTIPSSNGIQTDSYAARFGLGSSNGSMFERLVHFKFEPMILHILTSNSENAQKVLTAALQAGFRESGAINVAVVKETPPNPMVAIRSHGLSFESVVGSAPLDGKDAVSMVSEAYLGLLVRRANERFEANAARIARFQDHLKGAYNINHNSSAEAVLQQSFTWEDSVTRRTRKKKEGLAHQNQLRQAQNEEDSGTAARDLDLMHLFV